MLYLNCTVDSAGADGSFDKNSGARCVSYDRVASALRQRGINPDIVADCNTFTVRHGFEPNTACLLITYTDYKRLFIDGSFTELNTPIHNVVIADNTGYVVNYEKMAVTQAQTVLGVPEEEGSCVVKVVLQDIRYFLGRSPAPNRWFNKVRQYPTLSDVSIAPEWWYDETIDAGVGWYTVDGIVSEIIDYFNTEWSSTYQISLTHGSMPSYTVNNFYTGNMTCLQALEYILKTNICSIIVQTNGTLRTFWGGALPTLISLSNPLYQTKDLMDSGTGGVGDRNLFYLRYQNEWYNVFNGESGGPDSSLENGTISSGFFGGEMPTPLVEHKEEDGDNGSSISGRAELLVSPQMHEIITRHIADSALPNYETGFDSFITAAYNVFSQLPIQKRVFSETALMGLPYFGHDVITFISQGQGLISTVDTIDYRKFFSNLPPHINEHRPTIELWQYVIRTAWSSYECSAGIVKLTPGHFNNKLGSSDTITLSDWGRSHQYQQVGDRGICMQIGRYFIPISAYCEGCDTDTPGDPATDPNSNNYTNPGGNVYYFV